MSDFFSLPMSAGPRDVPVGVDELGNPVYMTTLGSRYVETQKPGFDGSYVKAALNQARKAPLDTLGNVLSGAAQGAWDTFSAPGRAASGENVTMGDVADVAGMVSLPALVGKYDPAVANMGIRAYHGSPHDFDRFDSSKIGTGEGAQAYGHGLYFAEAEDVAREYRDALSPSMAVDGKPVMHGNAADTLERALLDAGLPEKVADDARWYVNRGYSPDEFISDLKKSDPEAAARVGEIWRATESQGHMYEVDINADPADFLDWDAPLSEQPQAVRSVAETTLAGKRPVKWVFNGYNGGYSQRMPGGGSKRIGDVTNLMPGQYRVRIGKEDIGTVGSEDAAKALLDRELTARGMMPEQAFNPKGSDVYAELVGGIDSLVHDSPNRVGGTAQLREAGIPGIKYRDAGSRGIDGAEGISRNYVVFDDSLIDIIRKYGIAGALPLGALGLEQETRAYLDRLPEG